RLLAIGGGDDLIAVIGPAQLALEPGIVLDDQQLGERFGFGLAHAALSVTSAAWAARSTTRKRLPAPSRDVTSMRPPIAWASWRASNAPTPKPAGFDETKGLNNLSRTKP